jgi:WD40 repeat protein/DNA-binding SARP family transcriptional activator
VAKQLQIQLFETFSINVGDAAIASLSQRERAQSLLGYLIVHRGQEIPRSKLAFQLWPDSTDAQALTNLRRELHSLKRDLPDCETYLSIKKKTLCWKPDAPCDIDVAAFEKALQEAQEAQQSGDLAATCQLLEIAAHRYQGTLLPHLYDEWITEERERLQQLAIQGLLSLVDGLQQQSQYRAAIRYAQQVLRIDGLNEAAYRQLVALHAYSGNRATALRLYHDCMSLLMEELGVEPGAALREQYEVVLNESESAVPPTPISPDVPAQAAPSISRTMVAEQSHTDWAEAPDVSLFYGRATELVTLEDWALRDRCRLIAILGMGGMGKTTLSVKFARHMAAASSEADFDRVVWRSLRYAPPWETLLADLVAALSHNQETQPSPARLVHWLHQSRCLVVLDNIETILQAGDAAGQYQPGYEAYGELFRLFAEGTHPSCLLITSREKPADVGLFEGGELPIRSLTLQGSPEAVEAIIQTKGLIGSEAQKAQLGARYDHMPLAVKIIASTIQELFDGDIELFLAEDTVIFSGLRRLLDQQFERLSQAERNIMFWLAINREWTTITQLSEDLLPALTRRSLLTGIEALRWRSLIEKQQGHYLQQPMVMEYVTEKLVEQVSQLLAHEPAEAAAALFHHPFHSHALLKATTLDYLRELQRALILRPILHQLQVAMGSHDRLLQQFRQWLAYLQTLDDPDRPSYATGNLINLLATAQADLTGWNFARLDIRQADLQDVPLRQVNFSQAHLERSVFATTLSAILDIDWSPDGEWLATADVDGYVRLWQAEPGELLHLLKGHSNWIHAVAFTPDSQHLASGGEDQTIRLWSVATAAETAVLTSQQGRIWALAFQPTPAKPALLASASEDTTLQLWDIDTGERLQTLTGHQAGVTTVQWLDANWLISGSADSTLRLWSSAGTCRAVLAAHQRGIWSLAVHKLAASGSLLIASGSDDGVINLWYLPNVATLDNPETDLSELTPFATLTPPSRWVWSLKFAANGRHLISGHDDGCLYVWDTGALLKPLTTGGAHAPLRAHLQQTVKPLRGHQSRVWGLAVNPTGNRLVSGGKDQTLRFWDLERCVSLRTLKGHTNWVQSIAFSPTGETLLSGYEDSLLRQWEVDTGTLKQSFQGHGRSVWAIAVSPDGQSAASGGEDETICLWDLATASNTLLAEQQGRAWSVAFSPNGDHLAWGRGDASIVVWSLTQTAPIAVLTGHQDRVWSVAFSPNTAVLASGSSDGSIRLWSLPQGDCTQVLRGHRGWVFCICWSADGKTLASSGSDGTIRLWDSQTGNLLMTLTGPSKLILSVQFSPDGLLLVSGGDDHQVSLWEIATEQCLQRFVGHQGWVWSVAFSPDGKKVASGSQDASIRLWDVRTQSHLQTLQLPRLYEGMNLVGATGLTAGQRDTLNTLGGLVE